MSENTVFYSQPLWVGTDSFRTTNQFHVGLNISKDIYGCSAPRFNFRITNFKNRVNNSISLSYAHVSNFIDNNKHKFKDDEKFHDFNTEPIIVNKKKFVVYFLTTKEYEETALIIISDRGEDYLDSEKFFMKHSDFMAMWELICSTLINYPVIATNLQILSVLEEINIKSTVTNTKLTDIYRTSLQVSVAQQSIENELVPGEEYDEPVLTSDEMEVQNELSSFITENAPKMDIPLEEAEEITEKSDQITKATIDELVDTFTKDVLNNDARNLEMLLKSFVSTKIPILKFIELIRNKTNISEMFPNSSNDKEINLIYYCNTLYLKEMLRRHLNDKKPIPSSVLPVRYEFSDPGIDMTNNISLMYSLYAYTICYSLINNQLKEKSSNTIENKEFALFVLKVITSPFIYSFLKIQSKEYFVRSVMSTVNMLLERNVFEDLFNDIRNKFNYNVIIDIKSIETTASKTYDTVIDKWDCLDTKSFINKLQASDISLLSYDDFMKCEFADEKHVEKFICLELNKKKNGKVVLGSDIGDISFLSEFALSKLGLSEGRFDNSNLMRFTSELIKGDSNERYILTIIDKINKGVKDLKGEVVEWNLFPDEILKAVHTWEPIVDKKVSMNYSYFKEKIQEVSLERDHLLALLKEYDEPSIIHDYSGALDV